MSPQGIKPLKSRNAGPEDQKQYLTKLHNSAWHVFAQFAYWLIRPIEKLFYDKISEARQ